MGGLIKYLKQFCQRGGKRIFYPRISPSTAARENVSSKIHPPAETKTRKASPSTLEPTNFPSLKNGREQKKKRERNYPVGEV